MQHMLDAIKLICMGIWHVAVLRWPDRGLYRSGVCVARGVGEFEGWVHRLGMATVGEKTGKPYNIIGFSAYLLFYNEFAIVNLDSYSAIPPWPVDKVM